MIMMLSLCYHDVIMLILQRNRENPTSTSHNHDVVCMSNISWCWIMYPCVNKCRGRVCSAASSNVPFFASHIYPVLAVDLWSIIASDWIGRRRSQPCGRLYCPNLTWKLTSRCHPLKPTVPKSKHLCLQIMQSASIHTTGIIRTVMVFVQPFCTWSDEYVRYCDNDTNSFYESCFIVVIWA